jgi:hypothetical protein
MPKKKKELSTMSKLKSQGLESNYLPEPYSTYST